MKIINFDNERKPVQKEPKSECVCPNNCYSQLQMAGLEEPEYCMHICPHPASNLC